MFYAPTLVWWHSHGHLPIFFQRHLISTKFTHVITKPFSHVNMPHFTIFEVKNLNVIRMTSIIFVNILTISPKQSIRPMRCIIQNVLLLLPREYRRNNRPFWCKHVAESTYYLEFFTWHHIIPTKCTWKLVGENRYPSFSLKSWWGPMIQPSWFN